MNTADGTTNNPTTNIKSLQRRRSCCFLCQAEVPLGSDYSEGGLVSGWNVVICNLCLSKKWNGIEPSETLLDRLRYARLTVSYRS
jgi:hypothetical protein